MTAYSAIQSGKKHEESIIVAYRASLIHVSAATIIVDDLWIEMLLQRR
jgi:hypothetical protein